MKVSVNMKLAGIIFSGIGFIFLLTSITCAYYANKFLNTSIVAKGKVVDVERT